MLLSMYELASSVRGGRGERVIEDFSPLLHVTMTKSGLDLGKKIGRWHNR